MLGVLESYPEPLDGKNVYLDRLIRANLATFKEAMKMSETVKDIFLETAEENGWLDDKFVDRKKIARKLLLLGISFEKVSEATELPVDVVASLL